MKNKLFILFGIIICLAITINSVSAFCVVQGYIKDTSGSFVGYDSAVYCQNLGTWGNLSNPSGALYAAVFGTFSGSCESVCGNVYVKAEHKNTNSIQSEPWLVGYAPHYPMNSGNMPGWNERSVHNVNITLLAINEIKPKLIPTKKPISLEQQKANSDKAINNFKSVITKEYKNNQENLNKVEIPAINTNWFIVFWNRMIKFINGGLI